MKGKKPTIRDVAVRARVSPATVSYVLARRADKSISAGTQGRVRRAARDLGYQPNHMARALRTRRSGSIGVIIPGMTDPTMSLIVKGVEVAAAQAGYGVLVHDLEGKQDRAEGVRQFCARALDGLIYAFPPDRDADVLAVIAAARVSCVAIGRRIKGMGCVRYDQRARGRHLAEHLMEFGHQHIAILTRPPSSRMSQRIEGVRAAMWERGLRVDVLVLHPEGGERALFYDAREYDMGFEAVGRLFARRIPYTALIGTNDMVAAGAVHAAQAMGIRIPRDLSVASFGGFFLSEVVQPKLTAERTPHVEAARRAFKMLAEAMTEEMKMGTREEILPTDLIVRGSTGPAPTGRSRGIRHEMATR